MRILFLSENFPPEVNASATRVYERALYWVAAGHDVTILTCFPNFPQGRIYAGWRQRPYSVEFAHGIRVIRLPTYVARNEGFLRRTLDFVSFMAVAILATPWLSKPDVIAATSPQFFAAVAGWMIAALKRQPFVFELGDLWPASIRAVGAIRESLLLDAIERLELFLYRHSAAVVALTEAFKRDLVRRGIDASKITVVTNGVDLPRYSPRPKDVLIVDQLGLKGKFVVGYIGTHGLAHDLENALAAAELMRGVEAIRWLFVGDGAAKAALLARAAERRIDNVTFVPAQPKETMPQWWSVCDVALVHLKNDPVFAEVIPSKIFEAMAMGLPVVLVAPDGEATRLLRGVGAGICVHAGDPESLARTIQRLSSDAEAVKDLGVRSYAAAPAHSRRRQADEMLAVLLGVAERCRKHHRVNPE